MPLEPRKAGKALRELMSAASSTSDTVIAEVVEDTVVANRVADILVKMEYAVVNDGKIRLTEAGEAQKNTAF